MSIFKSAVIAASIALPGASASAEIISVLTSANTIVLVDTAAPATVLKTGAITGLSSGDVLTGIDYRPANDTLYSIALSGNLYRIAKDAAGANYTATFIADVRPSGDLPGGRYAIDFNPVADRLRFITDSDLNLRINVDTGATTVDTAITAPGAEAFVGAAYTNNVAGATSTRLYALDASGNQLALSTNPNGGTYDDVGVITGVDFGGINNVGFDISGDTGTAYFSNGNALYTLNLATAAATSLGTIGGGTLVGFSVGGVVPEPATWAMMVGGFGLVGLGLRRRRIATVTA